MAQNGLGSGTLSCKSYKLFTILKCFNFHLSGKGGLGSTKFVAFETQAWHNECFFCNQCKVSMVGKGFIQVCQQRCFIFIWDLRCVRMVTTSFVQNAPETIWIKRPNKALFEMLMLKDRFSFLDVCKIYFYSKDVISIQCRIKGQRKSVAEPRVLMPLRPKLPEKSF